MPVTCYLRLPLHVAHYIRYRHSQQPTKKSEPVALDNSSTMYLALTTSLFSNNTEAVLSEGVFCDRQWRGIMRRIPQLAPDAWPTHQQVEQAAGIKFRHTRKQYEYIRIKLPAEIFRNDKVWKVNGQWQLTSAGAITLKKLMLRELIVGLYDFCDKYKADCLEQGKPYLCKEARYEFMMKHNMNPQGNPKIVRIIKDCYDNNQRFRHRYATDEVEYSD